MFTESDYRRLSDIVFKDNYPGYRPSVIEAPNGDGNLDYTKRYAHVAEKYLKDYKDIYKGGILANYLCKAHYRAVEVAIALGVPKAFWPVYEYGALRVLEYPPGAITNPHTDFDLFTLMCYRNIKDCFNYRVEENTTKYWVLEDAKKHNHQIHFGELLELILPDAYEATPHEVWPDEVGRTQYSIVYFAIPDHKAALPNGQTVGDWLEERMARSRKYE